MRTVPYGPNEPQAGDLHLPAGSGPWPVVCLLHGGFWRAPHGRDALTPVALDLARLGYAAWNIGYRRIGEAGGGWPGTLDDVAAAVDHLATLRDQGVALDLARVVVIGHSAGGQLALWIASRARQAATRVRPCAAIGLAAVSDLERAWALDAGQGAVRAFLRASPAVEPARCAAVSPIALLPLGVPQLLLHGARDDTLPAALSRDYAAAARAAGDAIDHVELPDQGHMDFLVPASAAHAALCAWLDPIRQARPTLGA